MGGKSYSWFQIPQLPLGTQLLILQRDGQGDASVEGKTTYQELYFLAICFISNHLVKYYYSHFTNESMEGHRVSVSYSREQSIQEAGPEAKPR